MKGWFTEMSAKQKIQLPDQPEGLVQQLRGARTHAQLMKIWEQGQKEAYRYGVLALLLLTRILCALRRDERAATVFRIASLRWKQMLEKANAPKENAKLNAAQASMVMKAVADWQTGWNPLLDNTQVAETIVSQVRDPARPREVGGGAKGFGIELLAQLLPRPYQKSVEWIRQHVSQEIGADQNIERVVKALQKLQSMGRAVETKPGEWCRWEWATGADDLAAAAVARQFANPFKVGMRVHHDPSGLDGTVVGVDGEVVEFQADGRGHGVGAYPMGHFTEIYPERAKKAASSPASASRPAGSGRRRKSLSPFNHPQPRARAKSDNTPEEEEDFAAKRSPAAAAVAKAKSPRKTAKKGASSPAPATAAAKPKSPRKTAKKGASSPAPAGKAKPDQNGVVWG